MPIIPMFPEGIIAPNSATLSLSPSFSGERKPHKAENSTPNTLTQRVSYWLSVIFAEYYLFLVVFLG